MSMSFNLLTLLSDPLDQTHLTPNLKGTPMAPAWSGPANSYSSLGYTPYLILLGTAGS